MSMQAKLRRALTALALTGSAAVTACSREPAVEPATLVLRNGKVVTVNDSLPEAQAVAVRGYTIAAVGTDAQIRRYIGPSTQVIDLKGRLMVPGLIEGHGHFMGLGTAEMVLDLTTAKNFDDIVALVRDAVSKARPGDWIFGRGWHQEKWDRKPEPNVEGVPLHAALDSVSPANPVLLTHASGHAAFANGAALRAAHVTRSTRNPNGGEIVKDASGEPTGLLRETAQGLVNRAADARSRSLDDVRAERRQQVVLAGKEAVEHGITSFQDAGSSFDIIDFLKSLEDRNELPLRLYVMIRGEPPESLEAKLDRYRMEPQGNDYLTVRAIKQVMDGALGSHGAWLLQPYTDMPSSTGLNTTPLDVIERIARIGFAHGLSGEHPRDRRSRQPRSARRLRAHLRAGHDEARPALAHRARAASRSRRRATLRAPARAGIDAVQPRHFRRTLGAFSPGR